ncbi:DUF6332 family protein [Streptomyces sp. NPDC006544]|uniref:DUF6332 family protein n=1 Tax=Streptomyces sp. NPDC006544 TaxID=3154583 RepID=UPI0033BC978C
MGRRSEADRDAVTIEIVYALVSGGFAAALVFAALYGPAVAFDLSPTTAHTLAVAGGALAGVAFLSRVAHILWRHAGRREDEGG